MKMMLRRRKVNSVEGEEEEEFHFVVAVTF